MAFVDDQVIVVELPATTEFAPSVKVGAAGTVSGVTVNVTDAIDELPAVLEQLRE